MPASSLQGWFHRVPWNERPEAVDQYSAKIAGSLPLAWMANIGFEGQCQVSEQVRQWLRPNAPVILLADRFHPSRELLGWLDEQG